MASNFNFSGGDSEGINEINITPFVDIVLVLLIIFMISTPALVYRGMKVNLPKAVNMQDLSRVTLSLVIHKDGTLLLDKRPVTTAELSQALQSLKKAAATGDALISADAEVPHGKVMEISDMLRSQGISQVGFAAQPAPNTR